MLITKHREQFISVHLVIHTVLIYIFDTRKGSRTVQQLLLGAGGWEGIAVWVGEGKQAALTPMPTIQ